MNFLETLNDAQRRAVTAQKEPILVLAGPGTGKTRTLVGRILYLIRHYTVPPHKILAVTFTNKAKEEMKHRLREELGDTASDLMIGTFHRFCMTVLREHHQKAELPKQFTIADEPAQLLTLARVSRIQDTRSLYTVLNAISSYRLNKHNLNPGLQGIAEKWMEPYHSELRRNKLVDFDQILLFTQQLFVRYPGLVATYQQTFDAILVDEFQDTDPIQYGIMKGLAWQHRNIFVVADDDQSIFAWRGAHIENIAQYTKDFACREDQVIVLNKNYRSTQGILDIADRLINCGPRFQTKQIEAVTAEAQELKLEPRFLSFPDDDAEMRFILDQITTLVQPSSPPPNLSHQGGGTLQEGFSPFRFSDIAILYPTHAIGEQLETKLLAAHIPCQLIKRQGVFDQDEVRKIILLLTLLQNPQDDVALEQFFQLHLNNDQVSQQIQSLKGKTRSFKQTLHWLNTQRTDVSGISQSALRRLISTIFGMISNTISYLKYHPDITLTELLNILCNLITPEYSATIHTHVHQMSDPFDIPGMRESVAILRDVVDSSHTLYVCGEDAIMSEVCQCLLNKCCPHIVVLAPTMPEMNLEEISFSPKDVVLCLDKPSAEAFQESNIDSQFIFLAPRTPHPSPRTPIHSPLSIITTVFKLIQALTSMSVPKGFRKYTVFDLETTSGDPRTTRIVEIGATKVCDGEIIGDFGMLVNPEQPITQGAYNVHHISEDDVRDKKTFAEILPEFLDFIGDDMLVAHNGLSFDFPIFMRLYKDVTGKIFPNRRFDTLPMARRLFPGQPASVDALMQRFGIQDVGERHRALDDTIYLAQIFKRLQEIEESLNRRSEHEELLEIVALGLFVETSSGGAGLHPCWMENNGRAGFRPHQAEERLLFQLGAKKLLSRFSELPEQLRAFFEEHQEELETMLHRLSVRDTLLDEGVPLDEVFSGREVAVSRFKDLAEAFDAEPVEEAMQRFLDHAALYNSQDEIRDINAVNLLTIHSAKGLEFPVVFVSGVEKGNLPSFYSVREEGELGRKKIDEQRRLFYVAITRAKQKLFVTYVDKRGEYEKQRSRFLVELGVETEDMED